MVLAVFIGAVAQAGTGFGVGLTTLPVLAAVNPHYVPVTLLVLGLALSALNAAADREAIELRVVWLVSAARLPGLAAGVLLLSVLDPVGLQLACLGIALLSLATIVDVRAVSWLAGAPIAGALSGFMGAVAGVGGPPLAVALRDLPLMQVRATTGLIATVGGAVTLPSMAALGMVRGEHMLLSVLLTPVVLGAIVLGRRIAIAHAGRNPKAVISVIIAAGCVVLAVQVVSGHTAR